jgi:hypothetical protein
MNSNSNMHAADCKCFSWQPVVAGALVAVGLTFLLNLFSIATGLMAYTTGSDGVESLALGGLLGAGIGVIASMFAAGWLTGYLSQRHCNKGHLGALYGFLAWCVALIIAIFITSHAQDYVSFYGHFLSGSANVMQVSSTAPASTVAVVASDAQSKSLVISTYIIFGLFFLSAFSCSLGGHCGMRHVCRNDRNC